MNCKNRIASVAVGALMIGVLSACGGSTTSSTGGASGHLAQMQKDGKAKIAIPQSPPYASMGQDNKPTGYLVDVTAEVMKELNVPELNATVTTYDAMIPGLQAKQFDMLPGALNITAARCKVIDFSNPLSVQQDALYMPRGNPKGLNGVSSIGSAKDVKLAVLTGSSQQAYATSHGVDASQQVTVSDVQAGIDAVKGGRADAFLVGQFTYPKAAEAGLDVVVDKDTPLNGMAVGFSKNDGDLREKFNTALEKMRTDGSLKKLYDQYGFTNADILTKTTSPSAITPECK